jgi:hypothetical protein
MTVLRLLAIGVAFAALPGPSSAATPPAGAATAPPPPASALAGFEALLAGPARPAPARLHEAPAPDAVRALDRRARAASLERDHLRLRRGRIAPAAAALGALEAPRLLWRDDTDERPAPLRMAAAPARVPADERSMAGLREVVLPDGSVMVVLDDRFLEYAVVRIDALGRRQMGCVHSAADADRAVRGPAMPAIPEE